MDGMGTSILGMKTGKYIRGIGGYSSATPTIHTYHFAATFEGDVWTFVACNNLTHTPSGSHGTLAECTVTSIVGII